MRMDQDEDPHIPSSARDNFKISLSKEAEEDNKFKALQEECDALNNEA